MSTFYGKFEYTIDEKGRLNVPAELRRGLGPEADDTIAVTYGYGDYLQAFGLDDWRDREEAVRKLPWGDPHARDIKRRVGSGASIQRLDGQGRIRISRELLDEVGIQDRVRVVGAVDCFELWNPERYDEHMASADIRDLSDFNL